MKLAILALLLAITAHAQSIPATYPDRMEPVPMTQFAEWQDAWIRAKPPAKHHASAPQFCTDGGSIENGPSARPQRTACNHYAPEPHKSHARRKVKR